MEGIVKAAERLRISYRTAGNCHESRHVSRKMREMLCKHLRQQGEQGEREEQKEDGASTPTADEPGGGEERRPQEPEQDLRDEVEALRAAVVDLRQQVEAGSVRSRPITWVS